MTEDEKLLARALWMLRTAGEYEEERAELIEAIETRLAPPAPPAPNPLNATWVVTVWPNRFTVCDRHHRELIATANSFNSSVRSTKLKLGQSYCGACAKEGTLPY